MEQEFLREDRNLSPCETIIMKAIWDSKKDISLMELMTLLREEYGKDYARTTIATFLLKLSEKDFVRTYRKGKASFAHPIRSEEEYKVKLLGEETDFWYHGQPAELVSALCKTGKLTKEDVAEIRRMLDELDN